MYQKYGVFIALLLLSAPLSAMWRPAQVAELASDLPLHAVVQVGPCSGVMVSANGLVLTSQHCLYNTLQYLSEPDNNLWQEGFLAARMDREPGVAPDLYITQTLASTDVTETVQSALGERDGSARFDAFVRVRDELVATCEQEPGVRCRLAEYNHGLSYELLRERRFYDVRLVYVPPESLALAGGLEQNWQWPRRSADFALLRLYVDEQGFSTTPAAQNRPYQPESYAALAKQPGVPGEEIIVAGFPGVTQRYRSEAETTFEFEILMPLTLRYLQDWQQIIRAHAPDGSARRLQYEPLLRRLDNQVQATRALMQSYAEDSPRTVLPKENEAEQMRQNQQQLEQLTKVRREQAEQQIWWRFFNELQLPRTAQQLYRLGYEKQRFPGQRSGGYQPRDMNSMRDHFRREVSQFDALVEQSLMIYMAERYRELPVQSRMPVLDSIFSPDKSITLAAREKVVRKLYAESRLDQLPIRFYWMERSLNEINRSSDPWLRFAAQAYHQRLEAENAERQMRGSYQKAAYDYMRLLVEAMEDSAKPLKYDANRTLRLSVGEIVEHNRFNFLSSADGSAGISGAPTFDISGKLIGVVFDKPAETLINDWQLPGDGQRSIHADLHYMLRLLSERRAGRRLLSEMGYGSAAELFEVELQLFGTVGVGEGDTDTNQANSAMAAAVPCLP